ncbi:MAG: rRNA maturation RNAse YbeY, partial [Chloroflexi bacterium]|nr:rRNA maturation RNAse YbeY [Chloroflexota bacterium]
MSWLESVAEKVLLAQDIDSRVELGLVIVGQERVRQLNFSYLGKDEPTDVLAFSMLPEPSRENLVPFVVPP